MRTHNTPRLCAGPQTAGAPIKFWNVASIGDDEGEITLYGDVVSRQPVDWWTGEPEPGLYIAPESFMEDLAAVKGKSNITIKINSCGGDLYTGIAIHNAIKGRPATRSSSWKASRPARPVSSPARATRYRSIPAAW